MRRCLLLVAGLVLAGCGNAVATATPTPGRTTPAASQQPSSPSPTPTPAPGPMPPAGASLAGCQPARNFSQLPVLRKFSDDADDVAVDARGDIWISASESGRIHELAPDGSELATIADGDIPEGLVPLPNGDVMVAEQRTNRIAVLHPATRSLTPFISLPNPSGNLGVDNISLGSDGASLLVPDSPGGRLLRVALKGGAPAVLASGLGRPVAAAELAGGTILVAAEAPAGLLAVDSSGAARRLGNLGDLDEVVPLNGLVYVTKLDSGQVLAVDPVSGASRLLVGGSPTPQGLAALADGRLILIDSTRRLGAVLDPCR